MSDAFAQLATDAAQLSSDASVLAPLAKLVSDAAAVAADASAAAAQYAALQAQEAADKAALGPVQQHVVDLVAQLATAQSTVATLTAQDAADQGKAAALQSQLTTAQALIVKLQAQLNGVASRFPGDPGPGRIVVGAIVSGGAGTADAFEKATGAKLGAHRAYFNNGVSDLAVPNGPALAYVKAEHAAGRTPMISVKLDWTATVAGTYDAVLRAFRDAVEALGIVVDLIVNHEPENDGQPAALYCQEQQHIRNVIGRPKFLSFGGSLMAYDWTPASGRTPNDWFPAAAADGKPTWDWCGLDQYAQTAGNPIEDVKFKAALVTLKAHGVVPAFTELGIRVADPDGPAKLTQLFNDVIPLGFCKFCYFDSDNNSTGVGWVLTGALLAAFVALLNDARAYRPAAA